MYCASVLLTGSPILLEFSVGVLFHDSMAAACSTNDSFAALRFRLPQHFFIFCEEQLKGLPENARLGNVRAFGQLF